MDLALPGDDHPARRAWRAWLAEHPQPTARQLAESGYVAPHWPAPWGRGAGPVEQLVIDEEMRRAGVRRPFNQIGIGWAGPTLLHAGTEAQKARYLLPLLAGEEIWCQLFSEPEAGSDLAAVTTGAERDGEEWVVQGRKVWTSFAHVAQLGILLARTDPAAPKHRGLSYFVCPMDAPGVTVRPLVDMTGAHVFNEVELDGVRLSGDRLVGEAGRGWELAKVTLGNERVSLSGEGALWGQGPTAEDLVAQVRRRPEPVDAVLRQRLVGTWVEGEILRLIRLRTVGAAVAGRAPGPEASVRKALADDHGQRVMELAKDVAGASGMVDDGSVWSRGYLFARALTIGGGTAEVQRDIIAERVLGLPSS